jgi:hypothetical protein
MTTKKLPMKMINGLNGKYSEFTKLEFPIDGTTYTVKVYPYFSLTDIEKTVQTHNSNLKEYQDLGIELDDNDFFNLLYCEIIRTFTDLTFPKNIKDNIPFFNNLINSDFFKPIMESFVQSEVVKVMNHVMDRIETLEKINGAEAVFKDRLTKMQFNSPEIANRVKRIPEA